MSLTRKSIFLNKLFHWQRKETPKEGEWRTSLSQEKGRGAQSKSRTERRKNRSYLAGFLLLRSVQKERNVAATTPQRRKTDETHSPECHFQFECLSFSWKVIFSSDIYEDCEEQRSDGTQVLDWSKTYATSSSICVSLSSVTLCLLLSRLTASLCDCSYLTLFTFAYIFVYFPGHIHFRLLVLLHIHLSVLLYRKKHLSLIS